MLMSITETKLPSSTVLAITHLLGGVREATACLIRRPSPHRAHRRASVAWSRVVTVAITDMPGRSANGAEAGGSRRILTGRRWTTFTKLPVAFSGGKRLKTDPVPGLRLSIVPVNTWSG